MAHGIAVFDSSGTLVWDVDGILTRVIGTATLSYAAYETGIKSITISGLTSTDELLVAMTDNALNIFSVTVSGETVSINRNIGGSSVAVTYMIFALRRQ